MEKMSTLKWYTILSIHNGNCVVIDWVHYQNTDDKVSLGKENEAGLHQCKNSYKQTFDLIYCDIKIHIYPLIEKSTFMISFFFF